MTAHLDYEIDAGILASAISKRESLSFYKTIAREETIISSWFYCILNLDTNYIT